MYAVYVVDLQDCAACEARGARRSVYSVLWDLGVLRVRRDGRVDGEGYVGIRWFERLVGITA